MELKINEVQLPAQITFNYDELKAELTHRVNVYKTIVYTADQIKGAKDDRSNLNKLKKALNDERIRREKEYMAPFNDFKAKVAELCGIIDRASGAVDTQIKAFEERQKEEKKQSILKYKEDVELANAEDIQGIKLPFNDKWLNASTSMKSIEDEIGATVDRIKTDLATLSNLPEFGFEAVEVYKSTLDMNKAIYEAQRMSQIAKAKAEREAELARQKAEAEARAQAQAQNDQCEGQLEFTDEESFGQAMNPPMQNIPAQAQAQEQKQWISFAAYLSTEDAVALKNFFVSRNINFKAV